MKEKVEEKIGIFTGHETNVDLGRLEAEFGRKKKFAQGYKKEALLALSHYPELKDIEIEFAFTESEHPMSAKPKGFSMFLPASKRCFIVSISTKISASKEPVLLRNLPFSLQVLQMAHELGHVVDYIQKNSIELLCSGICYKIPAMMRKKEQKADREAIRHGFGKQVKEFSEYIYELAKRYPQEKYYREYHKYYMTPGEADAVMKRLRIYQSV